MRARVIVGKPDTPTPIFSNRMRYVLVNPAWNVPIRSSRRRCCRALDHFARLGYEVTSIGDRLIVRQPPGEGNALGRIAFMFPNEHSVYLHDTPARGLFAEAMRALSHGCVRVEDPERLAEIVLGGPKPALEAAIGGTERTIFLPRPLPIHIEYFTAFVDDDGTLEERPDVYGLAQRVASILSIDKSRLKQAPDGSIRRIGRFIRFCAELVTEAGACAGFCAHETRSGRGGRPGGIPGRRDVRTEAHGSEVTARRSGAPHIGRMICWGIGQ